MLTRNKSLRLQIVMRFARFLGVPIDVHGSYFGNFNRAPKAAGDI